jgi:hypothetical protein
MSTNTIDNPKIVSRANSGSGFLRVDEETSPAAWRFAAGIGGVPPFAPNP